MGESVNGPSDLLPGKSEILQLFLWLLSIFQRKKEPEAAGRGIFSALYAAAEDKARELGIHVIELSVGQMNQKVIDIHKSHGYEIERVIMKKLV